MLRLFISHDSLHHSDILLEITKMLVKTRTVWCENPPLGLNFISVSIKCGDQYIREHRETNFFHPNIFIGVPQGGVNPKKVKGERCYI